jgi:tRNA (adenine57-N1/adenine58-N1)-methyltransferase
MGKGELDIGRIGTTICEGDIVVCHFMEKGPKMLRVAPGGVINTAHGKLEHDHIIGRQWGESVRTSTGRQVYLLRPTLEDFAMGLRRISNINYPKDISRILYRVGIGPGDRVLELGTGSGAMAISLAYAVGAQGRVYSYDIREDMIKCAGKNLRRTGLADRVELKLREKMALPAESDVDAVLMDIPTPWEELEAAWQALSPGGYLACTVPTYDQLGELAAWLPRKSFLPLEAMEILCRELRAEKGRTRPAFKMIPHTQMIQFAVKVSSGQGADETEAGAGDAIDSIEKGEP